MEPGKEAEIIENAVNAITGQTFISKILSNKYYLYAIIIVIVLIIIGFFLFKKYNKKPIKTDDNKNQLEITKNILNTKEEYYLLDNNNQPFLINPYFEKLVKIHENNGDSEDSDSSSSGSSLKKKIIEKFESPSPQNQVTDLQQQLLREQHKQQMLLQDQQLREQQQMLLLEQKQLEQKQLEQKQTPKLTFPQNQSNHTVDSDEDDNLASQDLTHDEIEGLKKQLLALKNKHKSKISALNETSENDDSSNSNS